MKYYLIQDIEDPIQSYILVNEQNKASNWQNTINLVFENPGPAAVWDPSLPSLSLENLKQSIPSNYIILFVFGTNGLPIFETFKSEHPEVFL